MFYCEACGVKNGWPTDFYLPQSRGGCEMCKKGAVCFDVPCGQLPSRASKIDPVAVSPTLGEIGRDRMDRHNLVARIKGTTGNLRDLHNQIILLALQYEGGHADVVGKVRLVLHNLEKRIVVGGAYFRYDQMVSVDPIGDGYVVYVNTRDG